MRWIDFFTDSVLRAPTIGTMLMCTASALVGVLIFVRKRTLLGETLSHASYPGVTLAIVAAGSFGLENQLSMLILVGAFLSSLLGFGMVDYLQKRFKVSEDSALCFVLSAFFGIGITIASYVQLRQPQAFRQIQSFLYGQAATMNDHHILLYGALCLLTILCILLFHKEFLTLSFDPSFARTNGMGTKRAEALLFFLIVLAVVIGIRCVGVVLMTAMFIAPAVAARQFTNQLSKMFLYAGFFGMVSGFFGNYFSVMISHNLSTHYPGWRASLPTGPMIVLVAGLIAFYALLFSPERGLVVRYVRIMRFRAMRIQENFLKSLWRLTQQGKEEISLLEIAENHDFSKWYLKLILLRLRLRGWICKHNQYTYRLTPIGNAKGGRIVRLHRLWELYLVNSIGLGIGRVHKSAEEMEHILTPELEKELTLLLCNPKEDPHQQPIPAQSEVTES